MGQESMGQESMGQESMGQESLGQESLGQESLVEMLESMGHPKRGSSEIRRGVRVENVGAGKFEGPGILVSCLRTQRTEYGFPDQTQRALKCSSGGTCMTVAR